MISDTSTFATKRPASWAPGYISPHLHHALLVVLNSIQATVSQIALPSVFSRVASVDNVGLYGAAIGAVRGLSHALVHDVRYPCDYVL